ncbi:MAG: universal stress protein, partial [Planctomycetales bacterium]|nr:universal stress protein [Planctomycetales bacterium]
MLGWKVSVAMETRAILCPVDFSSSSELALQFASQLAQQFGAALHLAYVEESP